MNNQWLWRIVIIILSIAFVPMIVSGTAALITDGVAKISQEIHNILRPLSMRGDERLEGVVRLCLYFISIALIVRFLRRN